LQVLIESVLQSTGVESLVDLQTRFRSLRELVSDLTRRYDEKNLQCERYQRKLLEE